MRRVSGADGRLDRRAFLKVALAGALLAHHGNSRAQAPTSRSLRIGFVLPSAETGATAGRLASDHRAAATAMRGAVSADEWFHGRLRDSGFDLHTRISAVPDSRSAARAAARLIAADRVDVLIGGFGAQVADAIADTASGSGVPFLNVGATDGSLRSRFRDAPVWHVSLDDDQYVDAIVAWHARTKPQCSRMSVVGFDDVRGVDRVDAAIRRLRLRGVSVDHVLLVEADEPRFADAARALVDIGEETTLLVLGWHAQLEILAQADAHGYTGTIVSIPDSVTQTRDWIAATVMVAPGQALGPRFTSLEPSVPDGPLRALGDRFGARWRDPIDGVAWTVHQAVSIIVSAVIKTGSEDVLEALTSTCAPGSVVDNERLGMTYWRHGRQLAHDVHVARPRTDASGGHTYTDKLAFAEYLGRVSAEGAVWPV